MHEAADVEARREGQGRGLFSESAGRQDLVPRLGNRPAPGLAGRRQAQQDVEQELLRQAAPHTANRVVTDEGLGSPTRESQTIDWSKHVHVVDVDCVGSVLLITLGGGGEHLRHIVAYHVVKRSWQIVLSDHPLRYKCCDSPFWSDDDEDAPFPRYAWQRILLESTNGHQSGLGMSFAQLSASFLLSAHK